MNGIFTRNDKYPLPTHPTSSIQYPASNLIPYPHIQHPASSIQHPASNYHTHSHLPLPTHPASSNQHPTSLFEYREMYTPILPLLQKTGVIGEGVNLAVFQNKPPFRFQNILLKDKVGYCRQIFQIVGRIGKNYIVPAFANGDKTENIHLHCVNSANL